MVAESDSLTVLETEALYREVEELLSTANDCVGTKNNLKDLSLRLPAYKYQSAYKQLQVIKGIQKLSLPSLEGQQGSGSDDALYGSTEHLAGVSPQHFIDANQKDLLERKGMHADLVPDIEVRLKDRCTWLAAILEHTGDLGSLVDEVAIQVDALDAAQHHSTSSWLGCVEDLKCYITLLSNLLDAEASAVQTHKLDGQRDIDEKECSYLSKSCQSLMAKIEITERRLLAFTYTSQSMPALKAVSKHLEAAEKLADDSFEQLSACLSQYEQLGPDFEQFADKYRQLLEDLRHAEYTVHEFNQAAQTSDAQSP